MSSVHYALFHALANSCADLLFGRRSPAQTNQAWRQTYRALDHGEVRRKCTPGPGKPILDDEFPRGIRDFARQFVKMQENRHKADYDPLSAFTRSGVEQLMRESRPLTTGTVAHSQCLCCFRSGGTELAGNYILDDPVLAIIRS